MIAFYGNRRQEEYLSELRCFFTNLRDSGFRICFYREFANYLKLHEILVYDSEIVDELPRDTRVLVSVGGDGTFLHASTWASGREIPILGINTGHLGYLTGFTLDDSDEIMDALQGEMDITPRMMLEITCDCLPVGECPYALNEVSISKGDTTSMVNIRAYIGGHYLADYLADGLVVSTPTGSTAYNLSCGGPILQPTVDGIVLSPIAPHSLTMRPLVVSADSELTLDVSARGAECHVGIDGRTFAVPAGSWLTICRAKRRVLVAQPRGVGFADVLRKKLRWGI